MDLRSIRRINRSGQSLFLISRNISMDILAFEHRASRTKDLDRSRIMEIFRVLPLTAKL